MTAPSQPMKQPKMFEMIVLLSAASSPPDWKKQAHATKAAQTRIVPIERNAQVQIAPRMPTLRAVAVTGFIAEIPHCLFQN